MARNPRRRPARWRRDVRATRKRSTARRRKALSHFKRTPPYKPSVSWWDLHALLTAELRSRGFASASLIALRILTEGVESGLYVVMLAYYTAVDDARQEWRRRR